MPEVEVVRSGQDCDSAHQDCRTTSHLQKKQEESIYVYVCVCFYTYIHISSCPQRPKLLLHSIFLTTIEAEKIPVVNSPNRESDK